MAKITKSDLSNLAVNPSTANQPAKFDRSMFDAADGELFAGLNIVKLEVGQADGPFQFRQLTPPRFLNDKYKRPIQTGVAVRCDRNGVAIGADIQLPASASMTGKLFDCGIAQGDVFAIARDANYTSKQGRDDCKAYIVKVLKRSGEKKVEPATEDQIEAVIEARAAELKKAAKKKD